MAMVGRMLTKSHYFSPARLDGKLAIVTDAGNGLGRETARGLAARGAR